MAPYLSSLLVNPTTAHLLSPNPELLPRLEAKNKETIATLDAKLEDAEKNLGETEISDALRAKATYLARIGNKVRCGQNLCRGMAGVESEREPELTGATVARTMRSRRTRYRWRRPLAWAPVSTSGSR